MKKTLFLLLAILTCAINTSAKVDYVPRYFSQISIEEQSIVVRDSAITADLRLSAIDEYFTIMVLHDTITEARVKAMKLNRAILTISALGLVSGVISTAWSTIHTPLTPLDADMQASIYYDGLNSIAASEYHALSAIHNINEIERLPITIVIENNTSDELCINDMSRGLTWYVRAYGSLSLSVGNPEINRLRIARVNQEKPQVSYALIQACNIMDRSSILHEDENVWIFSQEEKVIMIDGQMVLVSYILKDKKTMEERSLTRKEALDYKKNHK